MIDDYFDKIFVINLTRSNVRRSHIERQFSALNIKNYEFYTAVDGNALDIPALIDQKIVVTCGRHEIPLSKGELGCSMSHIGIYETMLERNIKNALIIEDDVIVSGRIHDLISNLMDQIPKTWDIIHFHTWVPIGCKAHGDTGRIKIAPNVYKGCDEWGGTVCYALTSRCAELLIKHGKPYRMTSDGLVCLPTARHYRGEVFSNDYFGFVTDPFLIIGFTEHTEIGDRGITTINPNYLLI